MHQNDFKEKMKDYKCYAWSKQRREPDPEEVQAAYIQDGMCCIGGSVLERIMLRVKD